MITKITCRYSFEVLDFHCNDFGFTFNIGVSYLGIYKTSMGIVETENGACRYARKSVSTIPDRFSLRHEKLSGIVETWSQ